MNNILNNINFELIWDKFVEGLRIIDENGIIVKVNDAFCKLFSLEREQIEGKVLSEIYSKTIPEISDLKLRTEALEQFKIKLRNNLIPEIIEGEFIIWNEKKIWLEVTSSIFSDSNNLKYVLSAFRDTTYRRRKEAIQEALYEISDLSNQGLELSRFYLRIHEIIQKLMIAKNFFIATFDENSQLLHFPYFVDEFDPAPSPEPLGRGLTEYVMRSGQPFLLTDKAINQLHEQGEIDLIGTVSLVWLGVPLIYKGNVFGAIVVQDYDAKNKYGEEEKQILSFVADQISNTIHALQIQQNLYNSEAQFRKVWESSFDGMRITDKNGLVLMANDAYCKIVEKTKEEVTGHFFSEYYESSNESLAAYKKNFQNETINPFIEKKIILWNKKEIWLELTNSYLKFGNAETVLLSVFRDITYRKNLLIDIENSEKKLKELNATKDVFFSIISHDLKGPFNSILGFSNVLSNDVDSLSKEQIKNFSNIISKTSKNIYSLLENLLQWSRIQTGRMENQPIKLYLKEKVDDVIALFSGNAVRKNINVTAILDKSFAVYIDQNFLNVILENIISNSIKFTPTGGKINIFAESSDEFIKLTIADTGIGMSQEAVQNLFKLNKIKSTAGTDKESGTGLGLVLCKELIESAGGKLEISSIEGQGSKFIISIPKIK